MIPFGEVQEGRRFERKNLSQLYYIKFGREFEGEVEFNCVSNRGLHDLVSDDENVTLLDTCEICEHFNPALNIDGQKCNKLSLFFGHGGEHGSGFLEDPATFKCCRFTDKSSLDKLCDEAEKDIANGEYKEINCKEEKEKE